MKLLLFTLICTSFALNTYASGGGGGGKSGGSKSSSSSDSGSTSKSKNSLLPSDKEKCDVGYEYDDFTERCEPVAKDQDDNKD